MPIKPPPPAGPAANNAKLVVTLILYSRPESPFDQAAGESRLLGVRHSIDLSPGIGLASSTSGSDYGAITALTGRINLFLCRRQYQ
ncbi:MAG: hypothetical protein JST28_16630 [Acidobacteria bacterium]|nr:hypothetical protein [Acidobacteriota bacterium]